MSDQAEFDLDRFIDMFDQALTSNDPRVVDALRSLLMLTILTRPETKNSGADLATGPLRKLVNEQANIVRKVNRLEDDLHRAQRELQRDSHRYDYSKYQWNDQWMTSASPLNSDSVALKAEDVLKSSIRRHLGK